MNTAKLIVATPDADRIIGYCARVSNPANQDNPDVAGLLRYCAKHGHWSVFEMANAVLEIETTRDIARQILRHRSFSFQEFCVAGDTMITLELPGGVASGKRSAYKRSIEHLFNLQKTGRMPSGVRVFDENSRTFVVRPIKEVFQTGVKPVFKVTLANGRTITSTKEHKFLTPSGFVTLEDAVGLSMINGRAVMSKQVELACNGVAAYTDPNWMRAAKAASIEAGIGLQHIADAAGASIHTIRKWLKRHGIQFTKREVASYTAIWNRGVSGYSLPRHRPETIEKIRKSARRGADSNLWRGGVDRSERLKIADWCNANRSEFLRAANYQCPCGSSKNLELHHIKSVASAPELAYEKANIQVLCRDCHDAVHSLSGEAKTWREKSRGNTLTVHWSRVVKVEFVGEVMTYDLEVDHPSHNYVANGIVTHNSQRYADVSQLGTGLTIREARLQDTKNRQNSIPTSEEHTLSAWNDAQRRVYEVAMKEYHDAINYGGIAKEQARALLPEGLTPSRLYVNGTIRSWITYLQVRRDPSTQKEHRDVANSALEALRPAAPIVFDALFPV